MSDVQSFNLGRLAQGAYRQEIDKQRAEREAFRREGLGLEGAAILKTYYSDNGIKLMVADHV